MSLHSTKKAFIYPEQGDSIKTIGKKLSDQAGKSPYRGEGMVPHVLLSTNCGLGYLQYAKIIFHFINSQCHSWLTTAQAVY